MQTDRPITVENPDADPYTATQQLGTHPISITDVTWHDGDSAGDITLSKTAGHARIFAGDTTRIVFWPARPIPENERQTIRQQLEDILDRASDPDGRKTALRLTEQFLRTGELPSPTRQHARTGSSADRAADF